MSDEILTQAVARATEQAFWDWAASHPSLAQVIDHLALITRTVEKLSETPEYHAAVADYHQSRSEMQLVSELINLAGPIIQNLLRL